jgi:MOSC domain-containing protein YiiM
LEGPPAVLDKDDGLYIGARLQIGTAIIEITEANNPCYRFNTQPWASAGQKLWGPTAPEGNPKQWFKSPSCPLQHILHPGVRGWLARVVTEGDVKVGDPVTRQPQSTKTTEVVAPPAKRRRKSTDPAPETKPTVEPKQACMKTKAISNVEARS